MSLERTDHSVLMLQGRAGALNRQGHVAKCISEETSCVLLRIEKGSGRSSGPELLHRDVHPDQEEEAEQRCYFLLIPP